MLATAPVEILPPELHGAVQPQVAVAPCCEGDQPAQKKDKAPSPDDTCSQCVTLESGINFREVICSLTKPQPLAYQSRP